MLNRAHMFPSPMMYEMSTADSYQPSFFTALPLQPANTVVSHAGMPTGMAISRCTTRSSDVANPHYVSDPLPQLCGIIVEPDRCERTSDELWLCARLLIPLSLIDTIPHTERQKLRVEVGPFQFRTIQAIQALR